MIQKGSIGNLPPTVEQLRAARALLGWSQTELASQAGLSLPTVKRVEGDFGPTVSEEARLKLQQALEAAGIEFLRKTVPVGEEEFRNLRISKRWWPLRFPRKAKPAD